MPYDEGVAHHEIGRHLDRGDPLRRRHLTCAAEILGRLNAAHDLERLRELEPSLVPPRHAGGPSSDAG